jgi:hypothetical protein
VIKLYLFTYLIRIWYNPYGKLIMPNKERSLRFRDHYETVLRSLLITGFSAIVVLGAFSYTPDASGQSDAPPTPPDALSTPIAPEIDAAQVPTVEAPTWPSDWPTLVCRTNAYFTNQEGVPYVSQASCSLLKMPNGEVVLFTCRHCITRTDFAVDELTITTQTGQDVVINSVLGDQRREVGYVEANVAGYIPGDISTLFPNQGIGIPDTSGRERLERGEKIRVIFAATDVSTNPDQYPNGRPIFLRGVLHRSTPGQTCGIPVDEASFRACFTPDMPGTQIESGNSGGIFINELEWDQSKTAKVFGLTRSGQIQLLVDGNWQNGAPSADCRDSHNNTAMYYCILFPQSIQPTPTFPLTPTRTTTPSSTPTLIRWTSTPFGTHTTTPTRKAATATPKPEYTKVPTFTPQPTSTSTLDHTEYVLLPVVIDAQPTPVAIPAAVQ